MTSLALAVARLDEAAHDVAEADEAARGPVDIDAAERAVADLLAAVGLDPLDERLAATPRRVASTFLDLITAEDYAVTTFANEEGYDELVLVRDIPFQSLCEHHLLPFRGVAHVGYVPRDRLVGISTLPRVVEHCSRGLQMQERLTAQIATRLERELEPCGVGVVVEAEQLCMSMRGVGTPATRTVTSAFRGVLALEGPLRSRFEN